MKKRFLLILMLVISGIIYFSTSSEACQWENVKVEANCSGFTISGVYWDAWDYRYYAPFTYSFVVVNGTERIPVSGQFTVEPLPLDWGALNFQYTDIWPKQFCGDVYVEEIVISYVFPRHFDQIALNPVSFNCICVSWCPRTPGYWKNHPESWPVSMLEIGGSSYTKDELIALLETPLKVDKDLILVKHLIAAKLNILSGSSFNQGVLDQADAYLEAAVFNEEYKNYLKDLLDAFNNSGDCD